MSNLVTIEISNHVADIRLNRPEKMNAVSGEMWRAIAEAGESLLHPGSVRAAVLSGNGRGFCAGLDMESFQTMGQSSNEDDVSSTLAKKDARAENLFQRAAVIWKKVPIPVIGALHGVAFGAGAQIALGTDIRFAAPDLRFSILEIKWGLIPDIGISQTLRNVVPLDVAKELTFTGRILSGVEAKELGLMTHVADEPLEAAMELAHEIATKSPDAIQRGKRLLEATWNAEDEVGLAMEVELQSQLIGSENQLESIKANFEKRAPNFKDANLKDAN